MYQLRVNVFSEYKYIQNYINNAMVCHEWRQNTYFWYTLKPGLVWPQSWPGFQMLACPQKLAWSQIWPLQTYSASILFLYFLYTFDEWYWFYLSIYSKYTWNITQDGFRCPQVIVLLKHIYVYRNVWLILVDFDTVYFYIPKYLKNVILLL